MKATRQPGGFEPVPLILENEEEAAYLWHLLNNGQDTPFMEYKEEEFVAKEHLGIGYDLWKALDNVYSPGRT